jgi:nucleoside-diphosphate-sugar epimerase
MDSKELAFRRNETVVAVTGARGFIGKRLVQGMLNRGDIKVRALVRGADHGFASHPNLTVVVGDLAQEETLSELFVSGCAVVNLAYDFSASPAANLQSAANLVKVASDRRIRRLVHCSTASVYGRVSATNVTEKTACSPFTEYGKTKLAIEGVLKNGAFGKFDFVNLRPTSVFGPNGPALKKLIANLGGGLPFVNYLNSCIFNYRAMNLVSVDMVVSAIMFILSNDTPEINGKLFLISQDEEAGNNFADVENYLYKIVYGRQYMFPIIPIPLIVLRIILSLLGRDNIDPRRVFESKKLASMGFRASKPFWTSLEEFAMDQGKGMAVQLNDGK